MNTVPIAPQSDARLGALQSCLAELREKDRERSKPKVAANAPDPLRNTSDTIALQTAMQNGSPKVEALTQH